MQRLDHCHAMVLGCSAASGILLVLEIIPLMPSHELSRPLDWYWRAQTNKRDHSSHPRPIHAGCWQRHDILWDEHLMTSCNGSTKRERVPVAPSQLICRITAWALVGRTSGLEPRGWAQGEDGRRGGGPSCPCGVPCLNSSMFDFDLLSIFCADLAKCCLIDHV